MTTTLHDLCYDYDEYDSFDSPPDDVMPSEEAMMDDNGSPVLVYQPQSHATPVRQRRQQRRRRSCLTEILWDDVQRARDLLRLSRRRRRQEHRLDPRPDGRDAFGMNAPPPTATPALRSLKRHCRASLCPQPQAPTFKAADDSITDAGRTSCSMSASSTSETAAATRFRELKQILLGLTGERRPEETAAAKSASSGDTAQGRISLPTQYLLALPTACGETSGDTAASAELRQLQDEVAVQSALVEANGRLLRECQGARLARWAKRRRTMDFARSQEKLKELNVRIAQIRTRDLASLPMLKSPPRTLEHSAASMAVNGCPAGLSKSALSLTDSSVAAVGTRETFGQLKKSVSLTSSSSMSSDPAACGVSHAGSLDSGFQEMPLPICGVPSLELLLACDFQLIDQDDDAEIEALPR